MTNKEAIEILKPLTEYSVDKNGIGTFPMVSTPLQAEALDIAIKVLEEQPQGKWIPVSERLPEQGNKSYLVTVDYGNGLVCSCQRFFFNDGIGWNDDCVTAWQPLPESYKGDKEG